MGKMNLLNRIRRFYNIPEHNPDIAWTRSKTYQRRLEQVKIGWIITGLLMLISGSTAVSIVIGSFSLFMTLGFLERD
ncbi:hypothetical protein [Bacterioplanoides pacificum]|uniref:Uncharacterized protein n=1 Tax=Bacterioplanoides pacificum TaxID=1171596 RepID=A0ABV7VVI9_9GAMM